MTENRTMEERYAAIFRSALNVRHVNTIALDLITGVLLSPMEDTEAWSAVKRINQASKAEIQRRQG